MRKSKLNRSPIPERYDQTQRAYRGLLHENHRPKTLRLAQTSTLHRVEHHQRRVGHDLPRLYRKHQKHHRENLAKVVAYCAHSLSRDMLQRVPPLAVASA